MSFYDLYVGDASDPKFHWDGGDYSGKIPESVLDLGSPGLMGCVSARSLLESPKYGGRVLDWGASGARLNKGRICEFLDDFAKGNASQSLLLEKVQSLDDGVEYILVACEQ